MATAEDVRREVQAERRYWFELYRSREGTHRERDDAAHDARVLIQRLAGTVVPLLMEGERPTVDGQGLAKWARYESLRPSLVDYCLEVTLNIRWYERARRRATWAWRGLVSLVLLLGAGVAASAFALSVGGASSAWLLLFAAVVPVVQAAATAVDSKSRMGAFWRASAELKENLYGLEAAWTGKCSDETGLEAAVAEARRAARRVAREERASFFGTYRSPGEILATFSAAWSAHRLDPPRYDDK